MIIGHIGLSEKFDGDAHRLLRLVLALARRDIEQRVVVACATLAARLEANADIEVSRCVASPMDAYCAFSRCDLAHAHDPRAAKTALLLKLTTAQSYVLSHPADADPTRDRIVRSAYRRAAGIVCASASDARAVRELCDVPTHVVTRGADADPNDDGASWPHALATDHLRVYRRALDRGSVPDMLL